MRNLQSEIFSEMHQLRKNLLNSFSRNTSNIVFKECSGKCVSYSDILELGEGSSFKFTERKLVLCMVDNTIGGLSGYLALLISNAIPLMVSPSISAKALGALMMAYRPNYAWLPESKKNNFERSKCLMSFHGHCLINFGDHDLKINSSLSLMLSTSGSTGSSKYVRLSHKNVFSNANSIAQYLGLNSAEIPITILPPSYSYGLSVIHSHIILGATIAVTQKTFFDREFWNFLREAGVSSMSGVPYHYEMLKKLRFFKMQTPRLKTLTQAGGRMDIDLVKEFALHCANHGAKFFTMYGQTEATARISYLQPQKAIDKAGSVGMAIPGSDLWLEDSSGQIIYGENIIGELICEGPHVSMGYAESHEDLSRGDDRNGVLRTGDLAQRDADGDFYIMGRLARFVKLFGYRVNLLDVENFLYVAGYIVACAGRDDRLEIYVQDPKDGQAVKIKLKIMEYLKVASTGVAVFGVTSLPRNSAYKICYADLTPEIGELLA
uniref:AMP-binding protein n=1 Tax=Polynucleobacter sp. TaxID=2029855 RepID=UPI0040487853